MNKKIGAAHALLALALLIPCASQARTQLDELRASGAIAETDPVHGAVRFIGFDPSSPERPKAAGTETGKGAAVQHMARYAPLLGADLPDVRLEVKKHALRASNRTMTRFAQTYKGLPVIAGESIANVDGEGRLLSIVGRIAQDLRIETKPIASADAALRTALEAVAKWHSIEVDRLVASAPELSIYDSRLLAPGPRVVATVWKLSIRATDLRPIDEFVLVDAKSGVIRLHFNQIPHARKRFTRDAGFGLLCGELESACTAGRVPDADYAHRYAGETYDFYFKRFGRDSIDGLGMPLNSSIDYCTADQCPYPNAFWDGTYMIYGKGYSRSLDVVAHELTHGVTQNESQLFYYYQSGAINESLSDIFGELVQQASSIARPSAANRWLLGEGIGTPFRNMADPPAKGHPDRMTSSYFYTGGANLFDAHDPGDRGGVHTNSGIGNKAAYLLVDGGSFNGRAVQPLGLEKTAQIFYEAQINLLTSGSDYLDLYNALSQACLNLSGSFGITSLDCQQVRNATDAVEMNQQPIAGYNPDALMCPVGQVPLPISGQSSNFEFESSITNPSIWRRVTNNAAGGRGSAFADGSATNFIDERLRTAPYVTLPANAFVRFDHAFDFETGLLNYDGGVLEYSIANGPWTPLTSIVGGKGYNGTINPLGLNALAGRTAFVGASHGWVSTKIDLSAFAGQSFSLGWRIGTDSTTPSVGWWVDNREFYTCVPGFNLSVATTGHGFGEVRSSPVGIECDKTCSRGYATGTTVTLNAFTVPGSRFAGWSGACNGTGSCTVTIDSAKSVLARFEDSGWSQTPGSDASWAVVADPANTTNLGLRSRPIDDSQLASISYTNTFAAGTVSFQRRVSSEAGYDYLEFLVDGNVVDRWSGELAWQLVSYPMTAGTHTLTWRYTKDVNTSSGEDAAAIDQLSTPTLVSDSTPDAFTFLDQPNVFVAREVISSPVRIKGINVAAPISVTNGAYSVGCTGTFTSAPGTINAGENVCVKHTSAATSGTANSSVLTVGGVSDTFTSVTTPSKSTAMVSNYYRSILQRNSDAGGQSFWEAEASRMQSLQANINEAWFAMAGTFYSSSEYRNFGRTDEDFVKDLYTTFFNRIADPGGVAFWRDQIVLGVPRDVIMVSFMFSPEFVSFTSGIFGNVAARAEVDTVVDFYRGLLSRLPDTAGFNFWVSQFRAAQCQGASAVKAQANAISTSYLGSQEYVSRGRSNQQYVGDLYNAFLRRGGDQDGVLFWLNALNAGLLSREQVRQAFADSAEFSTRVNAIVAQGCIP